MNYSITIVANRRGRSAGFSLVEVVMALAVVAMGLLGAFAMVWQSGKLIASSEEEALGCTGLEQRMTQLRGLTWAELTDGTGVTAKVWTARPESMTGITVAQETLTISPYDLVTAQTLQGTWNGVTAPSVTLGAGADSLSDAGAVKVIATMTWNGRQTARSQTRSLVTIISRGGISKSALP